MRVYVSVTGVSTFVVNRWLSSPSRYSTWATDGRMKRSKCVTGPPEELAPMIGRVAEIKGYGRNDETGAIRHPVFLRLRDDKRPEECVL